MKPIRMAIPSLVVLCLMFTACIGHSINLVATTSPTARISATTTPPVNPHGSPTQPKASPAISPTTTGTPAFTQSDVSAYFQQHPTMPFAKSSEQFAVASITFASSRAVHDALHGNNTGFPDSAILCLVRVTGLFSFPTPPGDTANYKQGFVVFDGATGDLIMSGGLRTQSAAGGATSALFTTRSLSTRVPPHSHNRRTTHLIPMEHTIAQTPAIVMRSLSGQIRAWGPTFSLPACQPISPIRI